MPAPRGDRPIRASGRVNFEEHEIDAIFAHLDSGHFPGVAVGIAIQGKPVYRKGFGLAHAELPVVLTPTTRMRIGSTTKHFTALAFLLLCEAGLAHPDDPLGKYLPALHPVTHAVTPRQLMNNTSGLRDAQDICWQFSGTGRATSTSEILSLYETMDDVNAPPGEDYIYNNGGFLLLGALIERIAGRSLEEVFSTRIFAPIGMHDSSLRRVDTDFVPNSATLHMTDPGYDRAALKISRPKHSFVKASLGTLAGEAGIVSSVEDMLRWMAHMDHPIVGSQSTWHMMKTPGALRNGASTGYGLGLAIHCYRGVEVLSHPGGVMGGNSQMLKIPAAGLDVVILSNRADVSSLLLANRVVDACLPDLDPRSEPSEPLSITGAFQSPTSERVLELFAHEGRQVVALDGIDMPFNFDKYGTLWPSGVFEGYTNQKISLLGDRVRPHGLQLDDFGCQDTFSRIEPVAAAELERIAGRYRCEATGTDAFVSTDTAASELVTHGRFGKARFALSSVGARTWRARSMDLMPWGGILCFSKDAALFRFTSFRTRALTFRRAV